MTGWIYNLFMSRLSPAGYAATKEDWQRMSQFVTESEKAAGTVRILTCDSTWASERWNFFGLERFPSVEAIVAHKQRALASGFLNIFNTQVYLGSSAELVEPIPPMPPGAQPVFKLWISRMNEAAYVLPAEQVQEKMAKVDSLLTGVGGKRIVTCDCWSSERYPYFGVEQFPNLDAVREYDRCLREINWYRYIDSETLLGVPQDENLG
jgi:hypothetical protein